MAIDQKKVETAKKITEARKAITNLEATAISAKIDFVDYMIKQKEKKYLALVEASNAKIAILKSEMLAGVTGVDLKDFFAD